VTHRGWSISAYRSLRGPLIRWGEKLGAPRISFVESGYLRAGFEPYSACGSPLRALTIQRVQGRSGSLGQTMSTARLKTGAEGLIQQTTPRRAEFFAPPRPYALSPSHGTRPLDRSFNGPIGILYRRYGGR